MKINNHHTSLFFVLVLIIVGCDQHSNQATTDSPQQEKLFVDDPEGLNSEVEKNDSTIRDFWFDLFRQHEDYRSDGFDYPVGPPDGEMYYNIQGFYKNYHLGDDWNRIKAGNKDKGDPLFSIANGIVKKTVDEGYGWGNCLHIIHLADDTLLLESVYAHCDKMLVKPGELVKRGDLIATMGDAHGAYNAHLHIELRDDIRLDIGGGYDYDTTGFINPQWYIDNHRPIK
ncbi:M23 family metallopeptidase [Crocinitomix catalasitica]|nr:M23 family metallopeptidase [Crocinitomix catalasitica]